jgi:hypothetical protein
MRGSVIGCWLLLLACSTQSQMLTTSFQRECVWSGACRLNPLVLFSKNGLLEVADDGDR